MVYAYICCRRQQLASVEVRVILPWNFCPTSKSPTWDLVEARTMWSRLFTFGMKSL